jgi:hypothetical protein
MRTGSYAIDPKRCSLGTEKIDSIPEDDL